MIVHWNGTTWTQIPSPSPGTDDRLFGLAITSHGNAWAVGNFNGGSTDVTLILHWNGTKWKRVPSPSPGSANYLASVTAASPANAWAVGTSRTGTTNQTLILRWNGTRWKQTASANQGGSSNSNFLEGVSATSAGNAWAVGSYASAFVDRTLILRWNVTKWKRVPSPNPGLDSALSGRGRHLRQQRLGGRQLPQRRRAPGASPALLLIDAARPAALNMMSRRPVCGTSHRWASTSSPVVSSLTTRQTNGFPHPGPPRTFRAAGCGSAPVSRLRQLGQWRG